MTLNHYAINKVIGAKIAPGRQTRFGHFGLMNVLGQALKNGPRRPAKVDFDIDMDRTVFNAFMEIRQDLPPESVLIDKKLASRLHKESRRLGLSASGADITRRLQNIRKNPSRYAKHGLIFPKSEKSQTPSIVSEYAHVIEFALSKLRIRYGATIDDVLISPEYGEEYEQMVAIAAPELSSSSVRLAALYIRKSRFIPKDKLDLVESLNAPKFEKQFEDIGTLDKLIGLELKPEPGIIQLLERGKYLYISQNKNLLSAAMQIASNESLRFMSNELWQPRREDLSIRIFAGDSYLKVPLTTWQLRLIEEESPVFNYPITRK